MESPRDCGVWKCGFVQTSIDLSAFVFTLTGFYGLWHCLWLRAVPDGLFIFLCCNACLWGFGSYVWHVYGGPVRTQDGSYTFPYEWVMHVDGLCMMLGTHLNATYAYSALLLQYSVPTQQGIRGWALAVGLGYIVIYGGLATALLLLVSTDRGHEKWNVFVQIFAGVAVVLHVVRVAPALRVCCDGGGWGGWLGGSWQGQTCGGFAGLGLGCGAVGRGRVGLFADDKYSTIFHTIYHTFVALGLYLLSHSTFEQFLLLGGRQQQTSTVVSASEVEPLTVA